MPALRKISIHFCVNGTCLSFELAGEIGSERLG